VGEYAATSDGFGTIQTKANIWSAIEEAGYLTGLERNADVVKMVSYAPTFAKINAQSWTINMLWFNSQELVLSPDYFVQMLFAHNTGNRYIKTEIQGGKTFIEKDIYESVTADDESGVLYVKIVNASGKNKTVNLDVSDYYINRVSMQYISELFKGAGNEPEKCYVTPAQKELTVKNGSAGSIEVPVGKYSVSVVRIAYGEGKDNKDLLYELPDSLPKDKGLYVPLAVKAAVGGSALLIALTAYVAVTVIKVKRRKIK
jgi:alpha-L-arabinofuranosidase